METIIRQVRDIEKKERRVLEHMLGQELNDNQQITVQVVTLARDEANMPEVNGAAAADELPDWCNVYEGLSDEQVADLESVILERANLTRPS